MADFLPSSSPLPLNVDALSFDTLGLSAALQRSLAEQGLASPTPIQAQAVPAVLQGRDVWASAPTGSGKTLAFALPRVQLLQPQPGQYHSGRATRALVLVPTRELAVQIGQVLSALAWPLGLKVAVVYGGVSINPQMMGLRGGADVLAAFKAGRLQVVVTTDLASRGIDIALLPVVLNYDLPRSATDYTHRIGRTGRAGAQGLALSFVTAHAQAHWQLICKRTELQLPLEVVPGFEPLDTPPAPMSGGGGIKGKRPSKKDNLRALASRSLP